MRTHKDMWVSVVGEELSRRREPTNWEDRFAVMVTNYFTIAQEIL